MTISHYENFPVASYLIPKIQRRAVVAVYNFARAADDIADEGDISDIQRLNALSTFQQALNFVQQSTLNPESGLERLATYPSSLNSIFEPLSRVVKDYQLPIAPFDQLLSAFKQDVSVKRYEHYDSLLDYCSRSANPVGHLMLLIFQADNEINRSYSNAICTALQLANFWQDVALDWEKGRIYIPLEDLQRFNVGEQQIAEGINNRDWRNLMAFEINRTKQLFAYASPLVHHIKGRFSWELRGVIQGGLRILERIEQCNYDVFRYRPTIGKRDVIIMLWRSLWM